MLMVFQSAQKRDVLGIRPLLASVGTIWFTGTS
jgi:hypothetical protein